VLLECCYSAVRVLFSEDENYYDYTALVRNIVGIMLTGENRSTFRKKRRITTVSPQIPNAQAWQRTRASASRGQQSNHDVSWPCHCAVSSI
jgi:hypothetical protein